MNLSLSHSLLAPQRFVDNIGMYRLVSGSLATLAGLSVVFGFIGWLPYSGQSQLLALVLAVAVALFLNIVTAKASGIPANHESAIITALILFFLVIPGETVMANWPLVAAVAIGIMSKFTLVYKKQHFLNPAAFGAAALSVPGLYVFSWWVGNPTLFIPLVVLGGLVVLKVRKWTPVLCFLSVGLLTFLIEAVRYGDSVETILQTYFMSWPVLFLGFYMLTEPFTMPPTKSAQAAYGVLVGFLVNTALFAPLFSMTPELALLIGNVAVAPLRLRQKLHLTLIEKKEIAKNTFEFVFKKPKGFTFIAGQYIEWMLPHSNPDHKGIRRYFTIGSSPTESTVRAAMKIEDTPSSFKQALRSLDMNGIAIGSQLAGDFVLPKNTSKKLGFIAGGIGVTPFRSHIQFMIDADKTFDSILFYGNNSTGEIAYESLFAKAAATFSFAVVHVISREAVEAPYERGYINAEIIKRRSPDYCERIWYISGPPGMVRACKRELRSLRVPLKHIKTDFFSGA